MASTAVDPMTQGAMASQYINPKNDAEQFPGWQFDDMYFIFPGFPPVVLVLLEWGYSSIIWVSLIYWGYWSTIVIFFGIFGDLSFFPATV